MALGLTPFRHRRTRLLARASLIALWLLTAAVSLIEFNGQSRALLADAATPAAWIAPLIVGGALLDGVIGLAMWRWHRRWVYLAAALAMLAMTVVATLLLPGLWLDPLGRLSKNLPIAALLLILHEDAPA
ncbi:DoxX-like family protein [Roseateles amylovorans]|uniref:DoxX-like family protein n=1 Tax=Roseateles amylovorans TaxID=2978473 RepID=A0ABY6B479_9BURK|nr:DoxX-like family protein [Roseateles amylovorans]UXH80178.1 DoxX-like family protein [Roseateles amylovorans]